MSRGPFEMFLARIKGAEYRGEGWRRRILGSDGSVEAIPYHTLRVFLGYQRNRPCIEMPITYIDWGMPNPEWTCGIIAPEECFRIHVDLENLKEITP